LTCETSPEQGQEAFFHTVYSPTRQTGFPIEKAAT
jgi:hypothetical protein